MRATHWLIGAARDDAEASRLADAASALPGRAYSPEPGNARQAGNDREIVQLLRTRQLELAIMSIDAANDALSGGAARFAKA